MNRILRLPPPNIVGNRQALNAWFASLDPQERGALLVHTQQAIDALPPQRRRVFNAIVTADSRHGASPMQYLGNTQPSTTPFNWGAMFGGLAQIGGGLLSASITGDIQKDIAKNQANSAIKIAQIQADSGAGTQALFAGIQGDVAKTVALLDLEKARARNKMIMVVVPVSLGVVGIGAYLYMRKSKKRSR